MDAATLTADDLCRSAWPQPVEADRVDGQFEHRSERQFPDTQIESLTNACAVYRKE